MLKPEDIARRAAAKRVNESFKLIASALNAMSLATIGATFLRGMTGCAGRKD